MKKALLLIILFSVTISITYSQKVKYKDLYLMLEAKKYDDAEPFLRRFLSESKNADHPNANFQMALMFQEKSFKNDVLLDADNLKSNIDTALIYYDNALKYITDKEVRRNDEYYHNYQRRDIRTGKFGVKLKDVQFDIEKRQKSLLTRKERVEEVAKYYKSTAERYNKAFEIFASIRKEYETEKQLYLQGGDELIETLGELSTLFTKVIQDFNKYESTLNKIPQSNYDPSLQLREILEYTNDGKSQSDLTADNVDLWDFGKWSEQLKSRIKNEIYPMKENLIAFDKNLNALDAKLKSDSISVVNEIGSIASIDNALKTWDNDPLPTNVFRLKIANLEYQSYLMQNKQYTDSIDFDYRQAVISSTISKLTLMDSLANLLIGRDLENESSYYSQFVQKQFNNADGLAQYAKAQIDLSINEKRLKELESEKITERMKWLIDDTDSIPIFQVEDTTLYSYQPILINDALTTGIRKNNDNQIEGYFTLITPERTTRTKTFFTLNNSVFNFARIKDLDAKVVDDGEGDIYYVLLYSTKEADSSYVANLSKIYSSDGLAWDKEIEVKAPPLELGFNASTGEITISYGNREEDTEEENTLGSVIVDKKGNTIE